MTTRKKTEKTEEQTSNVIWLENGMHLVQDEKTTLWAICYGNFILMEPRHQKDDARKLALSIAPSAEHLELLINLTCVTITAREKVIKDKSNK